MVTVAEERAQSLIDAGWFQVSRKFRHLARLPEGKTGIEALIEARLEGIKVKLDYWIPQTRRWAEGMGEAGSAEHFMRVYARYTPGLTCELDRGTFEAFLRLGGCTRGRAPYDSRRAYGALV